MASQVVKFAGLSDRDRRMIGRLPKLAAGDRMELHARRSDGKERPSGCRGLNRPGLPEAPIPERMGLL